MAGCITRVAGAPIRRWRRFSQRHLATVRQRTVVGVMVLSVVAGMVIPLFATESKASAWWNNSWSYRKAITVDNTDSSSTLTNFPILVTLNTSNLDYSKTKAAGADLRFVNSDDTTALSYQIETWNSGGTSTVWVKIPSFTATQYTIYMYYGNAAATDAQAATSVWDANFRGVWHLNQSGNGTAGEFADSTSNGNDGRGGNGTSSAVPSRVAGQIGYGNSFDNSNDYIQVPYSSSIGITTDITTSGWVKRNTLTSSNDFDPIMTKGDTNQAIDYEFGICHIYSECSSNNNAIDFQAGNGSPSGVASTGSVSANAWNYLSVTRSGSTVRFYINGVLDRTTTMANSFSNNTGYNLLIGADDLGTNFGYFNGVLDELRLSNTARSTDWTRAEYLTGSNQMNTFASEQTQASIGWWNNGWNYRRAITIDNSASTTTLGNFTVRVSLTASNITYSATSPGGADIRFTDGTNTTPLSYEIEQWNPNGTSDIWVKVPSLVAGTNTIYMYYGNASAVDNQTPKTAWGERYTTIQHMNDTPGPYTADSTSYGNKGNKASANAPTPDNSGKVAGAQYFNGSPSVTTIADQDVFSPTTNDMSVSAWVQVPVGAAAQGNGACGGAGAYFLGKGTTGQSEWMFENDNNSRLCFTMYQPGGSAYNSVSYATTINDGNYHFYEATMSYGGTLILYRDGVQVATSSTVSGTMANGTAPVTIGAVNGVYATAEIDEVRISRTVRSADWVKAEYNSANNTIASYGLEEAQNNTSGKPDAPVITPISSPASTTPVFNMVATDQTSPNYLRYKIEICTDADCTNVVRTVDQTASQSGWSGQDAQTNTAYVAGTGGAANIQFIQQNANEPTPTPGSNSFTVAYSNNVLANSLLVAEVRWGNSDSAMLSNCQDTKGNTYTLITIQENTAASMVTGICYAINTGGAGANSITANFTTSQNTTVYKAIVAAEYSGVATTNPVDVSKTGQGTASAGVTDSVTSGTVSTNVPYALVLGMVVESGTAGTNSVGTGFTSRRALTSAKIYMQDRIQNAPGAVASTYTFGAANPYSSQLVAFKPASSASTQATYTYQAPALAAGTKYYWRAYAIDPGGSNTWSAASPTSSFTTPGPPAAPTLSGPADGAMNVNLLPDLRPRAIDPDGDNMRYKIEICSNSDCSTILRTADQTASQIGWITQSGNSATTYASGQDAIYRVQAPAFTANTMYYWRAYAIDPSGSNTWSPASDISAFTTGTGVDGELITGGTTITGGTQIGR